MNESTTTSSARDVPQTTHGAASAVLRIQDLAVQYVRRGRGTTAVDGVSLQVGPGESVALVGESGSGKTTIARSVLGLLDQRARVHGTVEVAGHELLELGVRGARRLRGRDIGYVPQDPGGSLDPLKRVLDQVVEPLRIHRIGDPRQHRDRALQALRDAGLEDPRSLAGRWPHELSGGQRQRVLIAAAMVTEPALIVADEPTSALDVTVQRRILDRIGELTSSHGTSLLLITHDLAIAADRTDRTLALRAGKVVDEGPSRSLLVDPQHPYTRALVDAIPGRSRTLEAIEPPRSSPEDDPLVHARGIAKTFGSRREPVTALLPADLEVRPGDSIGIVGESGSGKTTLARILLGLTRPDEGDVRVAGRAVSRGDRAIRRVVQPVFQNPHSSFDPARTVGWSALEPVRALAPRPRAARQQLLVRLFRDVGLDPMLAARRPDELSGGQLQRVAIARALSVEPQVLVCDEAVSALDVTVQAQILALLARLQHEHRLALVFITHDLGVLRQVCRDVLVMRRGEVVERGATAEVLTDPQTDYTRELIAAIPGAAEEAPLV
ncbi:ABC transporter ATP-binding protein [Brachybacterium halotolerans subsp. kimchii]|uniref:nickel ABC transporter ATP-binding protein NikE n=1 Tax=Brachybacterium halotolerans TaxID=2795215 RepID=UPI001E422F05|nr:ABC transporter ATP-binding protein [Brachybacterium halotolerans]UEJ84284.1 ABC transporter ATP-binding protein [Brachybacterium halotolerans subsp. kimchii]